MAENKKGTDMKMTAGFGKKRKEKELFGIIGLGRFGMSLAERLAEEGMELIAVDKEREKVNYAATFCENAFLLENLTRDNLEKIGIHQCDTVVVGIGRRLDVSVLTVLNLKNMGVKRVIAKSTSAEQGMVLEKLGAEVVYPEKDMGERLAGKLARPNILDYFSLGGDVDIAELVIGERADRMKVSELDVRRRFSINMIAITKDGVISAEIGPDTVVHEGNTVTVIGKEENIERFGAWLK